MNSSFSPGSLATYENDGQCILAVVTALKAPKLTLLNSRNKEVDLAPDRLHLVPGMMPGSNSSRTAQSTFLADLESSSKKSALEIKLNILWESKKDQDAEYSNQELAQELFGSVDQKKYLALRYALLTDKIYFKRRNDKFAPRSPEVVEELLRSEAAKQKKQAARKLLVEVLAARVKDKNVAIPEELDEPLTLLKEFAAESPDLSQTEQREAVELVNLLAETLRIEDRHGKEIQAHHLLNAAKIISWSTNPALSRYRVGANFSKEALEQAKELAANKPDFSNRKDLSDLEVFTVDDASTKDMDDGVSLVEKKDGYLLAIHISDVASIVPVGSVSDHSAKSRGTSLYFPESNYDMLPSDLAHNACSLVPQTTRPVLSCLIELDRRLNVVSSELVPAFVKLTKRLTYDDVDKLIEAQDPLFSKLYQISGQQEAERFSEGGFKVDKREIHVVIDGERKLRLVEIDEQGPARSMIGELMILANRLFADFAVKNKIPFVYRSQGPAEEPVQPLEEVPDGPAQDYAQRAVLRRSLMSLDPAPHSSLGLKAYAQLTSPIRRYLDLLNQRQILSFLRNKTPQYSAEDLRVLLEQAEEPLRRANQATKDTKRFWMLRYLELNPGRGGTLHGTVLRNGPRNALVELENIFMPTIAKLPKEAKAGDRILFKLGVIDPWRGYLRLDPQ